MAWGGLLGPAAFVSAWIVSGALRHGYSPVEDAISRLAAVGAPRRLIMTAGFVGFGVGVPVYAAALRASVPGPAWKAAAAAGVATLAVATTPLDATPTLDLLHGGFASAGYAALAATPLLAAGPLAASGRRSAARLSVATGLASAICLAGTLAGPAHGLFQRSGLTLGDAWLAASAVWMLSGGQAAPRARTH
jgi:hypothetical protein